MAENITDTPVIVDPVKRWEKDNGPACKKSIIEFVSKKNKIYDFTSSSAPVCFGMKNSSMKDLAGINLSGINFIDCDFHNGYFIGANFEGCIFSNVNLKNITFDACNFRNAEFINVKIQDGTTLSSANFEDALIDGLHNLSDDCMLKPIRYSRLRYRTVLLKTVLKMAGWVKYITFSALFRGNRDYEGRKHTTFKNIKTEGLSSSLSKEIKEHINWYQHLMTQIEGYPERKFLYKLSLVLAIVSTGYWNAYRALTVCAFSLNAFMATIIHLCPPSIFLFDVPKDSNGDPLVIWDWGTKFYYCIVTFTTLGYGDISPINGAAQFVAGFIAMSGYVMLGTLIYLMSRKADNKF